MTLIFDPTHDLDLGFTNFEISVSREWMGPINLKLLLICIWKFNVKALNGSMGMIKDKNVYVFHQAGSILHYYVVWLIWYSIQLNNRADSKLAPSQWEMALFCNDVSHWLGASLESSLNKVGLRCYCYHHVCLFLVCTTDTMSWSLS